MREFRLLVAAMLISSIVHLLILLGVSTIKLPSHKKKNEQQVHVSYKPLKRKEPVVKKLQHKEVMVETKKEQARVPVDIVAKGFKTAPVFEQAPSKQASVLKLDKKVIPKIDPGDPRRKVTIPILRSEKITNPKYLGYNHDIEYKIKREIYKYLNNPEFVSGRVCLTFVLLSSGALKEAKIVDSKTEANKYLRAISLKTLQEASPFTPFPKDLNYPELPFTVTIVFENQ